MSNFVFVHGGNVSTDTWNELSPGSFIHTHDGKMWGRVWDGVFPGVLLYGHRVYCLDLRDEHQCDLTGHVEQVCSLISRYELTDVILVGHSYGGMVITGTAAKMADRITRMVYVDAALPEPGQSLFDILKLSGMDPLSVEGLEPAQAYVEKLNFDPEKIKDTAKTYIRCTKSEFLNVTEIARQKISERKNEWTYRELNSSHLPMVEIPGELAKLLLEAVEK